MLERVGVDEAVLELRPDFAVLVMTAEGLVNGPSDRVSEGWLAEVAGKADVEDPHVEAWREAYRAFGAKPQRTRPSVDALLRRADALPSINRVVDAYNAVSVEYALPIGGEDLDAYQGPARLVRATGDEPFDVVAGGEPAVEHPNAGEVVWRDDAGVTCRRWNWRQCVRTRLTEAGDRLSERLRAITPDVRIQSRLIGGR
jgi:DNA/RNA-binding domain of Phe-tRNA-synthetase-like protein